MGDPGHELPKRHPDGSTEIVEMIEEFVELDLRLSHRMATSPFAFRAALPRHGNRLYQGQLGLMASIRGGRADALKEDARDFALWKAHKPGEDTSGASPWAPAGRWGIE